MPQLVGQITHDLGMVARCHLAFGGDIGDIGEFLVTKTMRPGLHHAYAAQAEIQRAQRTRKRNLLILVQLLTAKHQHRMPVHCRLDRGHAIWPQRRAQIEAVNFRSKRGERFQGKREHGSVLNQA